MLWSDSTSLWPCFSCPYCSLSPWARIKWTWCAHSAVILLCFSLQWLIRRVLLCGSCHFTHGYVKPVGGCSHAAVNVCVSMHDCVMKYWSVLSSTIGWPLAGFLSLDFYFSCRLYLSGVAFFPRTVVHIGTANLIWTHDRANPSQLQNEKAVGSDSIPTASIGSPSQILVPFAARNR